MMRWNHVESFYAFVAVMRRSTFARAPYKGRPGYDRCGQLPTEAAARKRVVDCGRGTRRKTTCGKKQRPQGLSLAGAIAAGGSTHGCVVCGNSTYRRATACGQGSRQRRTVPSPTRQRRLLLDEDIRGGLGHPFEKRMIMPPRI
ncbi:hypothetical protein BHM03_00062272 [Ensete ventricosum]|nr:hypothetical protein BHM03_00062272 [Ensete ventricosum]